MLKFTIESNVAQVADKLRTKYQKEFRRVMRRRLQLIGRHIVGELKSAAPRGATGNLRQGHDSVVDGTTLVVFNRVLYSIFRAAGAGKQARPPRPGHFPWDRSLPAEKNPPLQRWVKTKGIAQRLRAEVNAERARSAARSGRKKFKRMTLEEAARSAAFLVARAIKEKGSPPDLWFANTVKRQKPFVQQQLRSAVTEWIQNTTGGPT